MGITKFPNGISSMGMPVIGGAYSTTGSVWFVDSVTGSNGNSGEDKDHPFADLDYAIGKCTSAKGDIIFVMPGHTETAATQITCDVIGVSIIGLGRGSNKPVITAHASAVDLINVTAANVYIENIKLYYAASVTAFINIAAADFHAHNVWMSGAATPATQVTVTTGGARFSFTNCRFESETNGVTHGIAIEVTDINGWLVEGCMFNYHDVGCDTAGIQCEFKTSGAVIKDCLFIGMDEAAIDISSSTSANIENVAVNCVCGFGAAKAPSAAFPTENVGCFECYSTDDCDKGGSHAPATSDN